MRAHFGFSSPACIPEFFFPPAGSDVLCSLSFHRSEVFFRRIIDGALLGASPFEKMPPLPTK